MKEYAQNQNKVKHGGKREGAGRKPKGKARYTVTLDAGNVAKAKGKTPNFSGLLDQLLTDWLKQP